MSTIINATTTNGVVIQPDNSGSLQLATNSGTTAVTIDTSQNVGIGTTSVLAATKLDVRGSISAYDGGTQEVRLNKEGNIELSRSDGVPFIDFKSSTAEDYDCRIQQQSNGLAFQTGGNGSASESMRITSASLLQFNSGYGSVATAYGCRAWVNFNGTGTVAIRASGNVTSITDNGTGNYTINFTSNMPDANYAVAGTCMNQIGLSYGGTVNIADNLIYNNNFTIFTSPASTSLFDPTNVCVSVFR